jgi:hypothetical protein
LSNTNENATITYLKKLRSKRGPVSTHAVGLAAASLLILIHPTSSLLCSYAPNVVGLLGSKKNAVGLLLLSPIPSLFSLPSLRKFSSQAARDGGAKHGSSMSVAAARARRRRTTASVATARAYGGVRRTGASVSDKHEHGGGRPRRARSIRTWPSGSRQCCSAWPHFFFAAF